MNFQASSHDCRQSHGFPPPVEVIFPTPVPGGAVFKLETRASQSLAGRWAGVDMDHLNGPHGAHGDDD